jgi:2-hydroxy-6-oxonona-2,4-dienedioate hydrolase/4,5:9,10-diseco-3-hydroxy-5,9,17-trioxoandrosta-1(10),2-diene-4-oate hydrolase
MGSLVSGHSAAAPPEDPALRARFERDVVPLLPNLYSAALRLTLDRPDRVGRLVLMGPGGIGTTRRPPTPGLKRLLAYYGGEGPTRAKLDSLFAKIWYTAARPYMSSSSSGTGRYRPEVTTRPALPGTHLVRMDLRDAAVGYAPTLCLGADRVNRPSGRDARHGCRRVTWWPGRAMECSGAPDLFNALTTAFLSEESMSVFGSPPGYSSRPGGLVISAASGPMA